MAAAAKSRKASKARKTAPRKAKVPKSKPRQSARKAASSRRPAGRSAARGAARPGKRSIPRTRQAPSRVRRPKSRPATKPAAAARALKPSKAAAKPARPKGPRAQDVLEQGINALYAKDYRKARALFEKVLAEYSADLEVSDRARNYLKIVEAREKSVPAGPRPESADDLVDTGVLYHNQQNYEKAIEYFNAALRKKPEGDYIFFALASTYSRMGDTESALRHLKKAIELDPRNRILARNDPDFESLRSSSEFTSLLGIDSGASGEGPGSA